MITFAAGSMLPTKFGKFKIHAFVDVEKKEHVALVKGKIDHLPASVRVHSKCFTGDTLSSKRCDCRAQLEFSMRYISKHGGVLIYLDQEGRGIGLVNKIKAYALQDQGRDTVEANNDLGFQEDLRDFGVAAEILLDLGIKKIKLLTNNPEKIADLGRHGIEVVERIPVITKTNKYNSRYMETKKNKLNHML